MAEVRWIVYHHTHAGAGRPTVQQVADYQVGPTSHVAFPAIAYPWFIEEDGTAYQCHDLETVTWAQGDGSPGAKLKIGLNNWYGIAVAFSGENPTPAQLVTMRRLGEEIDGILGRKLKRLGHSDVSRGADDKPLTECPGLAFEEWRDDIQ